MESQISPRAQIGTGVSIGPFTVIHDDVVVGDNTTIGSHCVIGLPTPRAEGRPLVIGRDSNIRSHCVLYQGSRLGPKLETSHSALIRENTVAGINLRVGTFGDIQGDCEFGNCVRLHSDVHISQGSRIGHFVWFFPRVQFTNNPFPPSAIVEPITVCDLAIVATGTLLLPGIRVGTGAFIAAGSVVSRDVQDVECVRGNPAERFAWLDQFNNFEHGLRHPWPDHTRKVPDECNEQLDGVADHVRMLMKEARQARRAHRHEHKGS